MLHCGGGGCCCASAPAAAVAPAAFPAARAAVRGRRLLRSEAALRPPPPVHKSNPNPQAAALQMHAPRIAPATLAAIADVLRTRAPSLQGAPPRQAWLRQHRLTHARAVSEDGKRVRRAQPLAPGAEDDIIKAVEARSLYVAPFPMDSTLDGALALGLHLAGVSRDRVLLRRLDCVFQQAR